MLVGGAFVRGRKTYFEVALDDDYQDWAMQMETVVTFIRDDTVKAQLIRHQMVNDVWKILCKNESFCTDRERSTADDEVKSDDILQLLVPLSTSLIWCLSDTAAHTSFATVYTLDTPFVTTLLEDLSATREDNLRDLRPQITSHSKERLTAASCQIIGNLLWSQPDPATFSFLVETDRLHSVLIMIIMSGKNADLLDVLRDAEVRIHRVAIGSVVMRAYHTRRAASILGAFVTACCSLSRSSAPPKLHRRRHSGVRQRLCTWHIMRAR